MNDKKPQPQLSSGKGLLIAMTVIAISLVPIGVFGIEAFPASIFVFFLVLAAFFFRFSSEFWVCATIGTLALLIFTPLIDLPYEPPHKRSQCNNNIRQICLAIHAYNGAHGHFPPAYTMDADGKPLHSWRVLILPYLEKQNWYGELDLSKPWDHPVNQKFHDQMPDSFRCPEATLKPFETSYVSVAGDDMFWSADGSTRTGSDISDGASTTICIVESADHPVHWMSPHNPGLDQLIKAIAGKKNAHLVSGHRVGGNVGLCDGSCTFLPDDLSTEQMKAMFTRNGYEIIDFEW